MIAISTHLHADTGTCGGASITLPFTDVQASNVFFCSILQGLRMRWTPDGKAIIYRDDPEGLWRQALDDATPQRVRGFEESPMRQFAWSFDGKNLAYASGTATQEIVLIENFK